MEESHDCLHEEEFKHLAVYADRQVHIERSLERIEKALIGDNGEGMRGRVRSALVQLKFQWAILGLIFLWLVLKPLVI